MSLQRAPSHVKQPLGSSNGTRSLSQRLSKGATWPFHYVVVGFKRRGASHGRSVNLKTPKSSAVSRASKRTTVNRVKRLFIELLICKTGRNFITAITSAAFLTCLSYFVTRLINRLPLLFQCSKSCDSGKRNRIVQCLDAVGEYSTGCDANIRPATTEYCNTVRCDSYQSESTGLCCAYVLKTFILSVEIPGLPLEGAPQMFI